jgi:novobiocin biosynthesis protein NovU/D-mycarose 3-C-methyltransferase
VERIRLAEHWLDGAYVGLQGRAERIRTRLLDLIGAQPGIVAVYGAPAKATTLLNFCGLTAADLPWCIDTTPVKQGRFIPGTGIPIVAGRGGANTFLLAAHNYASSIIRRRLAVRWILPLPAPAVI